MNPRKPGGSHIEGDGYVSDPEDEETDSTQQEPVVGDEECGCLKVAGFFSVVVRARAPIIHPGLARLPLRAEAHTGRAARVLSQVA